MLVLTRTVGERVKIVTPSGEVIVLTIAEFRKRGHVRLLFEADRSITIDRLEVANAKEVSLGDR